MPLKRRKNAQPSPFKILSRLFSLPFALLVVLFVSTSQDAHTDNACTVR